MRVVVTRPEPEASVWTGRLRARGIDAVALPLIEIAPVADPAPLRAAWERLAGYDAVMFVSANAVRGFFAAHPAPWPEGARAWATGPGTRDALLAAGVPPERIDCPPDTAPQFDSEALWTLVHGKLRAGARVLVVRGGDAAGQASGRDWLAAKVAEAGGVVEAVVAYRRVVPAWTPSEQLAAAEATHALWLFSSSEAIANLAQLMPRQGWSGARALATHERIAQAARTLGFARVDTVRPAFDDVVASIESTAMTEAVPPPPEPAPAVPVVAPATTALAPAPQPPRDRSIPIGRLTLFALVLLTGAGLVSTAMLWQKLEIIQQQLARQSADSGANAIEARALARQALELARDAQTRQLGLETRVSEVALQRSQLEELMQSLSRSRDENLVVDVESALRLAQQQTQLTGSGEPLLAALRTADLRLARAAQPRLARLRAALARDMERVKAASVTDVPGVLARLDELARQVDDLPVVNAVPLRPAGAEARRRDAPAPPQPLWWQRWRDSVVDEARGLVRVSRIDQPEAALLAPEQAFFLRENLKLKLLNARLSLLARQNETARADVAAAAATLHKYFDPASRRTQAAASQLLQVQAQVRTAELPRIDETMAALATAAAGR